MMNEEAHMIVIFGATGDLAKRKLIPALYRLFERGERSASCPIVCLGRSDLEHDQYIENLQIKKFIPDLSTETFAAFSETICYRPFDLNTDRSADLQTALADIRSRFGCGTNLLFYLALPTTLFFTVAALLEQVSAADSWTRVVFEKPFGEDLASATKLNEDIAAVLDEDQVFRVDHYLGKELVQNILYLRFANEIFSCAWNGRSIDYIQISVSEALGVEERAGYYDRSGAVRDMLQNHLLQLLSLIAMEPPLSGHGNAIRDEAVRVIESLRMPRQQDVVLGQYSAGETEAHQYAAYLHEENVAPDSTTETYVALRAYIDRPRWSGVPFYLRTGKRLGERCAEIKIVFKQHFLKGFADNEDANMLIIRIQPDEGIALSFNVRKPGAVHRSESVLMDFCHHCHFGPNTPEAYEVILASVLHGDPLLFTRWDWLQASWRFIDRLRAVAAPPVPYPAGSEGPPEADALLAQDGRAWL